MTRRPELLLLLPALALALTACSGEDPKQAYVEQATAVCSRADAQFKELAPPTTPETFGPYVEQTVEIAERAQVELSALTPPPEDRQDLQTKVLTPFAALVEDGKAFADKVEAAGKDQAELLGLLSQAPTADGIDLQYLRSYGLGTCADAIEQAG